MPDNVLLEKYAQLIIEVGVNLQKDQLLVINSSTETVEFARLLAKAAYNVGAKRVSLIWNDPYITRYGLDGMSVESLEVVPRWQIDRAKSYIEEEGCIISITSPIARLNEGVDPSKMQRFGLAQMKALKFASDHMMSNQTQWSIIAVPNKVWAKQVFPKMDEEDAIEALWNAILKACRVTENNDPVNEWKQHNQNLTSHNQLLTNHQFKSLYFNNSLGTDLVVELVENHIWAGGVETSATGVNFNPNIPTEENFTMPYRYGVNGKVVATKPLNYQGKVIEDFWLEFSDGKVVNYDAKKHVDTLKNLLETDEGSSYIGEVALISNDSPINNTGILFFNTLFDENASCHLALGRAYPFNVKGGSKMTLEELIEVGSNQSIVHCDFMFGSKDMKIIGTKQDGTKITIFENGNYLI